MAAIKVDWSLLPLGTVKAAAIAAELGCNESTVHNHRKRLGIALPPRIDWSRQPLGEMTDSALATLLGVPPTTVTSARRIRGIASYTAQHGAELAVSESAREQRRERARRGWVHRRERG